MNKSEVELLANGLDPKSRYYDVGGIETADVLKAKMPTEQYKGWLLGNIQAYALRANFKGDYERDIEKIGRYQTQLEQLNKELAAQPPEPDATKVLAEETIYLKALLQSVIDSDPVRNELSPVLEEKILVALGEISKPTEMNTSRGEEVAPWPDSDGHPIFEGAAVGWLAEDRQGVVKKSGDNWYVNAPVLGNVPLMSCYRDVVVLPVAAG